MPNEHLPALTNYIHNYKNSNTTLKEHISVLSPRETKQLNDEIAFLNEVAKREGKNIDLSLLLSQEYVPEHERYTTLLSLTEKVGSEYKASYVRNKRNIYSWNKHNQMNRSYSSKCSRINVKCPCCGRTVSKPYLKKHRTSQSCQKSQATKRTFPWFFLFL